MGESALIEKIWEVVSYGGAAVFGLAAKLAWDKIKGLEKKTDNLQNRSDEIEKNYVKRFEDMQYHLTGVKEEIVGKINDLRVCLAESYVKKSDLPKPRTSKK